MQQYLTLLKQCLDEGTRQKNRTGVDTFMIPGGMMQFNLESGFPILTTKRINFTAIVGELCAFIRGSTSSADFRALGAKIWDQNANENKQWLANPNRKGTDDLGRIYGCQWRDWSSTRLSGEAGTTERHGIDQLKIVLEKLYKDPTDRRLIVTAWRPDELDQMALPACHLLWQLIVSQASNRINMCMYMRSCDMFLGVPFNISSYAMLLNLIAYATGYRPGTLTMFLADLHIYENHLEQVNEQLERIPRAKPWACINKELPATGSALEFLENISPVDIDLVGYEPYPPIKATMAV